ncbi:hypothetical protein KR51_00026260 [Rubidibacter lacunae KORDI 51-2]|uniref:Uncharacterized protein n=1 Tax=Rubidibacter lacunae KORDI 51-2 TaxID=582515 RepID=U5DGW4_9CHRO|nr:hypothetical protein KR51_00026260 [Rubidibacter lacunae KORDI 51-2]
MLYARGGDLQVVVDQTTGLAMILYNIFKVNQLRTLLQKYQFTMGPFLAIVFFLNALTSQVLA